MSQPPTEAQRRRRRLSSLIFVSSVAVAGVVEVLAESTHNEDNQEQLQQERILIKGNQGLPSTLFIAPWKKVPGNVPDGDPLESSLERRIKPVDEKVLRRELDLYEKGYSIE